MKSTVIKRSIVLNGHKTSVSLENEFWDSLREIACAQKTKLTKLAQQVDLGRQGNNLFGYPVYVLNHLRAASLKSSLINKEELKDRAADARL